MSDLYQEDDRSALMALFSGASIFSMGLSPLISGLFTNWRWAFWVQVIMCGIQVAAFAIFFKETRGSVLLSQKAQALNEYYDECEKAGCFPRERIRWQMDADTDRQSIARMLRISVYRPFRKSKLFVATCC